MLLEQDLLYVPNIFYSIWFNFIGTWIGFQGDFHLHTYQVSNNMKSRYNCNFGCINAVQLKDYFRTHKHLVQSLLENGTY